jgi:hypothetical protein
MEKIGFFETVKDGRIEKSSSRLNQFMALVIGLLIALSSVMPFLEVKIGDSLPMVLMLLGYSLGNSAWNKTVEMKYK